MLQELGIGILANSLHDFFKHQISRRKLREKLGFYKRKGALGFYNPSDYVDAALTMGELLEKYYQVVNSCRELIQVFEVYKRFHALSPEKIKGFQSKLAISLNPGSMEQFLRMKVREISELLGQVKTEIKLLPQKYPSLAALVYRFLPSLKDLAKIISTAEPVLSKTVAKLEGEEPLYPYDNMISLILKLRETELSDLSWFLSRLTQDRILVDLGNEPYFDEEDSEEILKVVKIISLSTIMIRAIQNGISELRSLENSLLLSPEINIEALIVKTLSDYKRLSLSYLNALVQSENFAIDHLRIASKSFEYIEEFLKQSKKFPRIQLTRNGFRDYTHHLATRNIDFKALYRHVESLENLEKTTLENNSLTKVNFEAVQKQIGSQSLKYCGISRDDLTTTDLPRNIRKAFKKVRKLLGAKYDQTSQVIHAYASVIELKDTNHF